MRAVRVSLLLMFLAVLVLLPAPSARVQAQEPAAAAEAPAPKVPPEIFDVVKKQFGPAFEVALQRSRIKVKYLHPAAEPPWLVYLTGDLDGDGVEDLVVVARCPNVMAGETDFDYKVTDPYMTYHGYGNPKITSQFDSEDPMRGNLVLVIFGAGPEGWRAEKPKSKWVLINLPFDRIQPTHVEMRKHRKMPAINLEEGETMSSVVYWDGKKWKWSETTGY